MGDAAGRSGWSAQPRRRSSERTAIERAGDAMEHAEDADGRCELEAGGARSRRGGPTGASGNVANASIARSGRVSESAERRTAATDALRSDAELADAECLSGGTEQQHDARERPRGTTDNEPMSRGLGDELADAMRQQGQVDVRRPWTGDESESANIRSVFAPGPNDVDTWRRTIDERPYLAPAIEPRLRLFLDGRTVVLDESRTDQLRCSGNGVVALCASVAFVELMRRVLK